MTREEFDLTADVTRAMLERAYMKYDFISTCQVGKSRFRCEATGRTEEFIEIWVHINRDGVRSSVQQDLYLFSTREDVEARFRTFREALALEGIEI